MAFPLVALFPGSKEVADAICQDVVAGGLLPEICSGAIAAIGWDLSLAVSLLVQYLAEPKHLGFWVAVIALSALSLIWFRANRRVVTILILALTAVVPLMMLGWDWGRWIHVLFSILYLVFARFVGRAPEIQARPGFEELSTPGAVLLGLAYAVGWSLPSVSPLL